MNQHIAEGNPTTPSDLIQKLDLLSDLWLSDAMKAQSPNDLLRKLDPPDDLLELSFRDPNSIRVRDGRVSTIGASSMARSRKEERRKKKEGNRDKRDKKAKKKKSERSEKSKTSLSSSTFDHNSRLTMHQHIAEGNPTTPPGLIKKLDLPSDLWLSDAMKAESPNELPNDLLNDLPNDLPSDLLLRKLDDDLLELDLISRIPNSISFQEGSVSTVDTSSSSTASSRKKAKKDNKDKKRKSERPEKSKTSPSSRPGEKSRSQLLMDRIREEALEEQPDAMPLADLASILLHGPPSTNQ